MGCLASILGRVENSDFNRFGPGCLTDYFATRQAESGTPQRILQALLGHAPGTRVTDRHYVQATEEAKRLASKVVQIDRLSRKVG